MSKCYLPRSRGNATYRWQFVTCIGISAAAWSTAARADEIINWNNIAQQAVLDTATDGVRQERALAAMHLAQFEALNSIEPGRYNDYTKFGGPLPNAAGADQTAALAQSAHDVLVSLYPTQQSKFDSALATSLGAVADGSAKTAGIALGSAAASKMLSLRANDHYTDTVPYTVGTGPGNWQPTGTAQKPAAFTQMPLVTPFMLQSGSQFRSVISGPPALDSKAFADAVNQIKDIGSANSTTRTPDQSNIAKFWYLAGGTTNQTPGLWNKIAEAALATHPMDTLSEARLFALLNVGQFDALTTSFDSKYQYNLFRPETAIHVANATGVAAAYTNPGIVGDPSWTPFLPAPNFPSYVSNHAAVDGAAEKVLQYIFNTDNVSFTVPTQGFAVPDRSFNSFSQAAQEGADSRIYAGIHYSFDATDGLLLGQTDQGYIDRQELLPIPEPGLTGLGMGVVTMLLARRRRRTR